MIVRALIELLPDQHGNLRTRHPKFRPNHNFGGQEDVGFFVGQVEIPDGEVLRSGEPRQLVVEFLDTPALTTELQIGREWLLQEGITVIGRARVLEVIG